MFAYNKKYEKIYDSYRMFDEMISLERLGGIAGCRGGPRKRWGPGEPDVTPAPDYNEIMQSNEVLKAVEQTAS
jgi:hypothetical protein